MQLHFRGLFPRVPPLIIKIRALSRSHFSQRRARGIDAPSNYQIRAAVLSKLNAPMRPRDSGEKNLRDLCPLQESFREIRESRLHSILHFNFHAFFFTQFVRHLYFVVLGFVNLLILKKKRIFAEFIFLTNNFHHHQRSIFRRWESSCSEGNKDTLTGPFFYFNRDFPTIQIVGKH